MKRQQVNMTEEVVGQQKRSWAEVLSGGNKNLGLSQKAGEGEERGPINGDADYETQKDLDTLNSFRELELRIPLKESRIRKRYDFMWDMQDRILSSSDRKKMDRSLRRKQDSQSFQNSELLGRSLYDSDLRNKWEQARKEAKETLELGKNTVSWSKASRRK
ncbi:hypothetical protein V6N12_049902 [Hibiscus sabdariffa]|uniref:Uncharacterized protein n=1 Tax=Hibiscus sabdariffa TaxID=183260 RepID=A0ABR2GAW0_9ROSI